MELRDLHEAFFEYVQSDSYLTFAQAWEAKDYMKRNLPRIFMMIKDLEEGHPPTLHGEKNNSDTWEPEHWYWFINNFIKND